MVNISLNLQRKAQNASNRENLKIKDKPFDLQSSTFFFSFINEKQLPDPISNTARRYISTQIDSPGPYRIHCNTHQHLPFWFFPPSTTSGIAFCFTSWGSQCSIEGLWLVIYPLFLNQIIFYNKAYCSNLEM